MPTPSPDTRLRNAALSCPVEQLPLRTHLAILWRVVAHREEFSVRFSAFAPNGRVNWYTDLSRPPLSR